MINNLTIAPQNVEAHTDIEHDIQKQKNGLFTFILRVDNGHIVDYNVVEYADIRKYLTLTRVIVAQFTVSRNPIVGNQSNTVRPDNGQRTA